MKIRILGRGCAKCNLTFELVKKVVAEAGVTAEIEKVNDLKELAKYGVFTPPAVVINEVVKSAGKIPTEDEIAAWVRPVFA